MKPYYSENGIEIYNCDCREIFNDISGYDLIVTDPPYGIGYDGNNLKEKVSIIGDEYEQDLEFILNSEKDVVVFGANNFPRQLPFGGRWICWYKRLSSNADRMLGSPFELAWTNRRSGYDIMIRVLHGGVVNADKNRRGRVHPTQKPISLMISVLNIFKNSTCVIDPFMGSGTTIIAAKEIGMKSIGIEIEEHFCEEASKFLSQGVLDFGKD
jgi:site-specific DNA-methyltransferase (adenine-specific)